MKDRKRWAAAALCAAAVLMGVGLLVSIRRTRAAENALRAVQENARQTALSCIDEVRWQLEKAQLSRDGQAYVRLLSQVAAGAGTVEQSLSLLPAEGEEGRAAVKFANQLGDYASSLLAEGEKTGATEAQTRVMQAMGDTLEKLAGVLRGRAGAADGAGGETNKASEKVIYPTLIYDGPFSDGREEKASAYLAAQPEIDRERALDCARAFLGAERVESLTAGTDTRGSIPCYGVTAQVDGEEIQLAVTRRGGKVLWMFPEHAAYKSTLTVEKCRENALAFLESRGYPDMESLYFQVYNGLAVMNFAPRQGTVLLYPDQVKVQLRMDTGAVVGFEARGYLTNHGARPGLTPRLTAEEAAEKVSLRLENVSAGRLCVIPRLTAERLCYEFSGVYQGEKYLVYVDAESGEQAELLKVVETDRGLNTV